jgi:hypothetical protein
MFCAVAVQLKKKLETKNRVLLLYSEGLSKRKFYTIWDTVRKYPEKFFCCFRMNIQNYDELLLKSYIKYKQTHESVNTFKRKVQDSCMRISKDITVS